MRASSLAAARAAVLRLVHCASASSSRPVPASAVAAARVAIRRLAHGTNAASSRPVSASAVAAARVAIRRLAHSSRPVSASAVAAARVAIRRLAQSTASPPVSASAVAASLVTTRGLAHKTAAASSSPPLTHTAPATSSPPSALVPTKPYSSAATSPTPPPSPTTTTAVSSRSVSFLLGLLDGMPLTNEEQLMFRKAFNEKYKYFKVADVLSYLEHDDFSFEECCFLLRIIHSKLGENKGLADLLLQEDINISCSNDELINTPILARLEAKVDILTNKVIEGNEEVLKNVRASNKSDWGTIEIRGRKLDLTKIEYLKKLVDFIMGM